MFNFKLSLSMKKILFILTMFMCSTFAEAQITTYDDFIRASENILIYKDKSKGKIDYEKSALALSEIYALDKHNAVSRSIIYNVPEKTKDQIYLEVNDWFVHSFGSGKSVIQLNDKESGCIIGKGYVNALGSNAGFSNNSDAAAWVIIRIDIKDEKVRVISTIQEYEVTKTTGAGLMMLGALGGVNAAQPPRIVKYMPNECFPYTKKEKGTGSKALTLAHCWIVTMFEQLNEAINNGVTGLEDDF